MRGALVGSLVAPTRAPWCSCAEGARRYADIVRMTQTSLAGGPSGPRGKPRNCPSVAGGSASERRRRHHPRASRGMPSANLDPTALPCASYVRIRRAPIDRTGAMDRNEALLEVVDLIYAAVDRPETWPA